jgi:predicted nuclease of predicted toxin-antitoxin system
VEIFLSAREAGAILMSKDADFLRLVDQLGAPPQIIWVSCGNTSNARMREVLAVALVKPPRRPGAPPPRSPTRTRGPAARA